MRGAAPSLLGRTGVAMVWFVLSLMVGACGPTLLTNSAIDGRPRKPDSAPVRILYIGNLCAGCAEDHLEGMARSLDPPRVVEVDSVVIPSY